MTPEVFLQFGAAITIDANGERAVLGVQGEVDIATAPTLRALIQTLIDQGAHRIVLDLSQVSFLDASGLGVMAGVSSRLARSGGGLTLRSVPSHVQRSLEFSGVDQVVDIEHTTPAPPSDALSRSLGSSDAKVDAALRLVVALASATVCGADGVSVSLCREGRVITAAASDETVLQMDYDQYATGEGPCLSAAAEGHRVHAESLATEKRWPDFTVRALDEGIASILSSPLLIDDRSIGALNIYSNADRAFGPAEVELAALFAEHVAHILVDADVDAPDEKAAERIRQALQSRQMIAQAQGVLMERHHVDAEEAASLLHSTSRTRQVSVLKQSLDVRSSTGASSGAPSDPA